MAKNSAIKVGTTITREKFVDKDDIRHLARLAGYSHPVHTSSEKAREAGYPKLVAPASLVQALVEAVVADVSGNPAAGSAMKTQYTHLGVAFAGDTVVVNVHIKAMSDEWLTLDVTANAQGSREILYGTVGVFRA